MSDPVDSLVLDLLAWIGYDFKPYADAMEVWGTACPALPIWEEANRRGFLRQSHDMGSDAVVELSESGKAFLAERRSLY